MRTCTTMVYLHICVSVSVCVRRICLCGLHIIHMNILQLCKLFEICGEAGQDLHCALVVTTQYSVIFGIIAWKNNNSKQILVEKKIDRFQNIILLFLCVTQSALCDMTRGTTEHRFCGSIYTHLIDVNEKQRQTIKPAIDIHNNKNGRLNELYRIILCRDKLKIMVMDWWCWNEKHTHGTGMCFQ